MRVITGEARGRKLITLEGDDVRPTTDRVKESLFSSIQFDIIGARVLDLFSGTGALGVECLSRGAKSVDFVDNNIEAIKIIKQNLEGIKGEFSVTKSDFLQFLSNAKNANKQYDIVLPDPAFDSDYGSKAIEYILNNDLLSNDGIIMYEKLNTTPFNLTKPGYSVKEKKYLTVSVVKIVKEW